MFPYWKRKEIAPGWKILMGLGGIILFACFLSLFAFVAMSLWNYFVPSVFGVGALGFWQALALVVLVRILVGFPGRHGYGHGRFGRRGHPGGWHGGHWEGVKPEDWRAYRDFWREEGLQAFEAYVEKRKREAAGGSDDGAGRGQPG